MFSWVYFIRKGWGITRFPVPTLSHPGVGTSVEHVLNLLKGPDLDSKIKVWRLKRMTNWWLTYPPEKWWSSSVGMIIPFPTEWKLIKFHGSSHHQPDEGFLTWGNPQNHRFQHEKHVLWLRWFLWSHFRKPPYLYSCLYGKKDETCSKYYNIILWLN